MDSPTQQQQPDQAGQPQNSDSAVSEGRRIYLGNLLYSVTPVDVEDLLREAGLGQYEKIHISVDPISGRNPGYCFVEFPAREDAEKALSILEGASVYNRILKVGPCHPKSRDSSRRQPAAAGASGGRAFGDRPTFERWGDWNSEKRPVAAVASTEEQGPYGAVKHFNDLRAAQYQDGTRLYVGGLGKMIDQEHNDHEMRELFEGFNIVAIGKRITPHPSTREKPGNHHYCFVDFASAEDADAAMNATKGRLLDGSRLRVFLARGKPSREEALEGDDVPIASPQRGGERRTYQSSPAAGRAPRPERPERTESTKEDREEREGRQREIMAASSWRTRAAPTTE